MCVCVWVCVFVDGWPKKRSYLQHFLPVSECPLCLLRYKDLYPQKPVRLEERMKDVGQFRSETLKQRVKE